MDLHWLLNMINIWDSVSFMKYTMYLRCKNTNITFQQDLIVLYFLQQRSEPEKS